MSKQKDYLAVLVPVNPDAFGLNGSSATGGGDRQSTGTES